jgi:hypothetical protein
MMEPTRKPSRRSFLNQVVGGVTAGGALTLLAGQAKAWQTYTGVTDSDTGNVRDRPGYGVGTRNRYTDQDTGPNRDAQFHGRGPAGRGEGGVSGTGRYGEAPSGCSDTDGGPGSDAGGRGVRCNGQTPLRRYPPGHTRHCTDSDRGSHADPVQQGVRC